MDEEQRKLVAELRGLLEEFEGLKGNYHKIDKEYTSLLKSMEKVALKIHNGTLKELREEDRELEEIIRSFRLKSTWMTFHGFKI